MHSLCYAQIVNTGRNACEGLFLRLGSGWYIWNNTGDTAILRDASGRQLDKCTFPGTSQGFLLLLTRHARKVPGGSRCAPGDLAACPAGQMRTGRHPGGMIVSIYPLFLGG